MAGLSDMPLDGAGAAFLLSGTSFSLTYQEHFLISDFEGMHWWHLVHHYSLGQETGSHIHTHLYLTFSRKVRFAITHFVVEEKVPHVVPCNARGRNVARAVERGHFYAYCPFKIDHTASQSNFMPGVHYAVPLEWIRDLWQQNKLSRPVEAAAHYRCLTPAFENQVARVESHQNLKRRSTYRASRQVVLRSFLRPFVNIPEVLVWRDTFSMETHRYKFLWLSGDTRVGKTLYAQSLFSNPFIHSTGISWTGYDASRHGSIIFDDICGIENFIIENKLLFQSSDVVTVQSSRTNCFSLPVDVAAKPIVVLSNTIPQHPWIIPNCVHFHASEPLFDRQPQLQDAPPAAPALFRASSRYFADGS